MATQIGMDLGEVLEANPQMGVRALTAVAEGALADLKKATRTSEMAKGFDLGELIQRLGLLSQVLSAVASVFQSQQDAVADLANEVPQQ